MFRFAELTAFRFSPTRERGGGVSDHADQRIKNLKSIIRGINRQKKNQAANNVKNKAGVRRTTGILPRDFSLKFKIALHARTEMKKRSTIAFYSSRIFADPHKYMYVAEPDNPHVRGCPSKVTARFLTQLHHYYTWL